jgi:predicted RNA-binding Zn-ribbon protein involved in translation (DUF1610 family)
MESHAGGRNNFLMQTNTTLCCPKCGNDEIAVPKNSIDESVVTCPLCRTQLGLWGDLITAALDAARENFEKNSNQTLWNALHNFNRAKSR